MRRFNYMFLKDGSIPSDVMNGVVNIYDIRRNDQLKVKKYKYIYEELESVAIVESIKASNAIEGIFTEPKRFKGIISKEIKPRNHSEQEIEGYMNALHAIHNKYDEISINELTILWLHKRIYELTSEENIGEYKKEDNVISWRMPDGTYIKKFDPIHANETREAMSNLLFAFQEAWAEPSINKLLLIGCFIFDFTCIHPFDNGNGRVSRLLTLLLLYKAGFYVGKYISLENEINHHKDRYYESLEQSSFGWHEEKNDYWPFVKNLLLDLSRCYKKLNDKFAISKDKKFNKSNRIKDFVLKQITPISKSEILHFMPDVSTNLVETILAKMLKNGEIKKTGANKNAKYIKK